MNELVIGLCLIAVFIVIVACSLIRLESEDSIPEEKFKKIYNKKKDESNFFLCDYCTKCKNKYSFNRKIDFFPYEETITRRAMDCHSPFDENEYVSSIKICREFELDKNKI